MDAAPKQFLSWFLSSCLLPQGHEMPVTAEDDSSTLKRGRGLEDQLHLLSEKQKLSQVTGELVLTSH